MAAPRHGVTPTHRHTDKVCAEMEPWDKWSPIVIQTPHLNWWPAWLHSTLHSRCCTGQNNEESCIKILVRDPATTATGLVTRGMSRYVECRYDRKQKAFDQGPALRTKTLRVKAVSGACVSLCRLFPHLPAASPACCSVLPPLTSTVGMKG